MLQAGPFHRAVLIIVAAACLAPLTTGARSIRVDAGDGNYTGNGQAWAASEQSIDLTPGNPRVAGGTLPFALNFGTGLQSTYCFSEDSEIWFGSCAVSPGDPGFSAGLIEPLAADWIAGPGQRIFDEGSVTFTEGRLSRGPGPFDPSQIGNAPLAMRFHWNRVLLNGLPPDTKHSFQAILIQVGSSGDFDLELNYLSVPSGIGTARFQLGTNAFDFRGPFPSSTDFDFQFRNGILINGTNGTVPEPATPLLLLGALAIAALLRRRKTRAAAR